MYIVIISFSLFLVILFGSLLYFLLFRKGFDDATFIKKLGPYRNLNLLSDKGGMALVYTATNEDTKSKSVLKILRSDFLGDSDVIKKFEREGEILKKLMNLIRMPP